MILSFWFNNNDTKVSNNITFIIDLSHSMNVNDVTNQQNQQTSRLDLAKSFINNLFEDESESNFGLILFSQKSNYFIPPTADVDSFKKYLDKLNTNFLPAWWSNIYESIKNFVEYSDNWTIWVLISDMWDNIDFNEQKEKIKTLKEEFTKKQLKLILIWVWKTQWWYVKYPNWEEIIYKWQKVSSTRNDEFGNYLSKTFGSSYIKIENSKQTNNIKILNNNISILNDKHKKYYEFAASLFWIFWI